MEGYELVHEMAQGNPGAMTCLLVLLDGSLEANIAGTIIIPVLDEMKILGKDIYILWSDICHKDHSLMAHLCKTVPESLLKDASSRQDYSGRELLTEYIKSYVKV